MGIDFELSEKERTVTVRARSCTSYKTGVEMEAMTGASIAALAIYDMLKGIEKGITISKLQLEFKSGGKSGTWRKNTP